MRRVLYLLPLLLLGGGSPLSGQVNADAVFVPISKYIYEGDAEKLSAWFYDTIELSVENEDAVMSRNQACRMMATFFDRHRPESFQIYHSVSKSLVKCVVGKMVAGGEHFNVSIFASNRGEGYMIQKLQIQKE
ncbi:MAG: DUF4783 domain-containing protein [Bacteroidales bacterium]|nr:DUF4783 domain-containing protein [Bacteroidales bacterium]